MVVIGGNRVIKSSSADARSGPLLTPPRYDHHSSSSYDDTKQTSRSDKLHQFIMCSEGTMYYFKGGPGRGLIQKTLVFQLYKNRRNRFC